MERQHHEVRSRQVGVVAEDRVPAELVPEARHPRLARQDRARVVGAVGALPRQDEVERERQLHDAAVLAVGALARHAHRDEGRARQHHEHERRERDDGRASPRARARRRHRRVAERHERRERGEQHRDRIAVPGSARRGQERTEPCRGRGEPLVVCEPPGQHARRIVEREVPRDEQQQRGNDGAVDAQAARLQLRDSSGGETGRRAPQAHTTLRTAHSILRKRPQEGQPR